LVDGRLNEKGRGVSRRRALLHFAIRVELESLIGFLVGVVDFQNTEELTVSRTGTAANVAADGEERAVRQATETEMGATSKTPRPFFSNIRLSRKRLRPGFWL